MDSQKQQEPARLLSRRGEPATGPDGAGTGFHFRRKVVSWEERASAFQKAAELASVPGKCRKEDFFFFLHEGKNVFTGPVRGGGSGS